jgi:hypothetical protein
MTDLSYFKSRSGKLTCNAEVFFSFMTDIRNFERFIPESTVNNWKAEKESCSFGVSMLGTVNVRLTEIENYKRIVFTGDALKKEDFSLILDISDNGGNPADVKLILSADLNHMMKNMAARPIDQFLEILINKMENFRDWEVIK